MRIPGRRPRLLLAAGAAALLLLGGYAQDTLLPPHPRHPAELGATTTMAAGSQAVGALFDVASGDHFCTASVVHSPRHNLAVTAAHCVSSSESIEFVPAYHDGQRPLGAWPVARIVLDPGWTASSDPDLDVGFLLLDQQDGREIEDVVGANLLGLDLGYEHPVRLTGYPDEREEPLTCANRTEEYAPHQLMIGCTGFTNGTSGGPWIVGADPATELGTLVGVIGGFEEGGGTADLSYSTYFDARIGELYQRAVSTAPR